MSPRRYATPFASVRTTETATMPTTTKPKRARMLRAWDNCRTALLASEVGAALARTPAELDDTDHTATIALAREHLEHLDPTRGSAGVLPLAGELLALAGNCANDSSQAHGALAVELARLAGKVLRAGGVRL